MNSVIPHTAISLNMCVLTDTLFCGFVWSDVMSEHRLNKTVYYASWKNVIFSLCECEQFCWRKELLVFWRVSGVTDVLNVLNFASFVTRKILMGINLHVDFYPSYLSWSKKYFLIRFFKSFEFKLFIYINVSLFIIIQSFLIFVQ